jgi:RNA polymerase subunit RPABC4/transcription elongation factor Spt4
MDHYCHICDAWFGKDNDWCPMCGETVATQIEEGE